MKKINNLLILMFLPFTFSCAYNKVTVDNITVERRSYFTFTSFSDFTVKIDDKVKNIKKEVEISGVVSDEIQALEKVAKGVAEGLK